jgi:hypothetical protein
VGMRPVEALALHLLEGASLVNGLLELVIHPLGHVVIEKPWRVAQSWSEVGLSRLGWSFPIRPQILSPILIIIVQRALQVNWYVRVLGPDIVILLLGHLVLGSLG